VIWSHDIGEPTLGGRHAEGLVGGSDQPARESDPLGVIGIEEGVGRTSRQHGRQLPCQVDGVADAGVHALAPSRAVDVSRIPQQKAAALAEVVRHPMVHVIGREPVYLFDLELQIVYGARAHVREGKPVEILVLLFTHRADQPGSPRWGQREDR
jgi:hypothetical protein